VKEVATAASVVFDSWGWCWGDEGGREGGREGGVELEEVELERSTSQYVMRSCPHMITFTHPNNFVIVSRRLLPPPMPPTRCPSPLMRDVGLSAWAKMRRERGAKGG